MSTEKFNHSKRVILVEVPDNMTSINKYKLNIRLKNIPKITIIVDPLRPIILPNINTINEIINGRNIIIKYN